MRNPLSADSKLQRSVFLFLRLDNKADFAKEQMVHSYLASEPLTSLECFVKRKKKDRAKRASKIVGPRSSVVNISANINGTEQVQHLENV